MNECWWFFSDFIFSISLDCKYDGNNNANCEYDGGDWCGDNVDTSWCTQCLCLDPAYSTTSISTTTPWSISFTKTLTIVYTNDCSALDVCVFSLSVSIFIQNTKSW